MDERGKREAGADVECTDALGPVNLVAGDGDHVRAEGFGLEGDLQKALHGVGVEQGEGT